MSLSADAEKTALLLQAPVAVAGKAPAANGQRPVSPPPLRPLPMNAPAVPSTAANAPANKSPAQPRRSRRGTASGDGDKPPGAARRRTRTASDDSEAPAVRPRQPSETNGAGPGGVFFIYPSGILPQHDFVVDVPCTGPLRPMGPAQVMSSQLPHRPDWHSSTVGPAGVSSMQRVHAQARRSCACSWTGAKLYSHFLCPS